jgi:glycine cleavage system regulatory protein
VLAVVPATTLFILDNLNISNIKSSDPSFSTQQNTYNVCVVAGIPEGMYSRFLEKQFTLFSGQLQALGQGCYFN